jgi:hypothetical protein
VSGSPFTGFPEFEQFCIAGFPARKISAPYPFVWNRAQNGERARVILCRVPEAVWCGRRDLNPHGARAPLSLIVFGHSGIRSFAMDAVIVTATWHKNV